MSRPTSVVRRGLAASVLAVVVGLGLGVQLVRHRPGADQFGTVTYVVAIGLLIMLLLPRLRPWLVAVLAAAAAVGIEFAQLTGVPAALSQAVPPLRLVLGSSFSAADVAWSVVGGVATWGVARLLRVSGLPRQHWTRGAVLTGLTGLGLLLVAVVPLPRLGIRYGQDVPWIPVAALLVVLVVGLVETWRGLSRADRHSSMADLAGRAIIGLGAAVVVGLLGRGLVSQAESWSTTAPFAVMVAQILVLTAILAIVAGWGGGAPQRGRTTVAFVVAAVTVVVAATVPAPRSRPSPSTPTRAPYTVPARPPAPAATRSVASEASEPPPAPAAGKAVPLCQVEQLSARTQGWDAAMGKTWVTVVVRNTSARDCAVEGLPGISLLQGQSPLELTISRESALDPGRTEKARRALVRSGGVVSVLLWWPGYRNAADRTTPQALIVHASGVGSVPVELDLGPAPFDLTSGGLVRVSAWL